MIYCVFNLGRCPRLLHFAPSGLGSPRRRCLLVGPERYERNVSQGRRPTSAHCAPPVHIAPHQCTLRPFRDFKIIHILRLQPGALPQAFALRPVRGWNWGVMSACRLVLKCETPPSGNGVVQSVGGSHRVIDDRARSARALPVGAPALAGPHCRLKPGLQRQENGRRRHVTLA